MREVHKTILLKYHFRIFSTELNIIEDSRHIKCSDFLNTSIKLFD